MCSSLYGYGNRRGKKMKNKLMEIWKEITEKFYDVLADSRMDDNQYWLKDKVRDVECHGCNETERGTQQALIEEKKWGKVGDNWFCRECAGINFT